MLARVPFGGPSSTGKKKQHVAAIFFETFFFKKIWDFPPILPGFLGGTTKVEDEDRLKGSGFLGALD